MLTLVNVKPRHSIAVLVYCTTFVCTFLGKSLYQISVKHEENSWPSAKYLSNLCTAGTYLFWLTFGKKVGVRCPKHTCNK